MYGTYDRNVFLYHNSHQPWRISHAISSLLTNVSIATFQQCLSKTPAFIFITILCNVNHILYNVKNNLYNVKHNLHVCNHITLELLLAQSCWRTVEPLLEELLKNSRTVASSELLKNSRTVAGPVDGLPASSSSKYQKWWSVSE